MGQYIAAAGVGRAMAVLLLLFTHLRTCTTELLNSVLCVFRAFEKAPPLHALLWLIVQAEPAGEARPHRPDTRLEHEVQPVEINKSVVILARRELALRLRELRGEPL